MFTLNHNSYLDIFVLMSLGLPNVRNILSEVTLKYIPLTICAKAVGTFYIPQKKHAERRLRYFIRMASFLRRTSYSVFASPEGVSPYVHGINPFNKGIFHMAMAAGIPIVPLFLNIPESINPYKGQYSDSGTITLEVLDEIGTSSWKLETIWEHIGAVRKVYVDHFNKVHNTHIE
jgi:1-acyl-sn-glycerol-3-phosphate acyltransferase